MELPLAWPTCTGVYALYLAALPCVLCIKTIIHPRNNPTHTVWLSEGGCLAMDESSLLQNTWRGPGPDHRPHASLR